MHSLVFLFREFLQGLSQNRFLHFTYGAQVMVSLLVLGIFFVLLIGATIVWNKLGASMEIHVFLEDDLSAQQINALEGDLQDIRHVVSVVFRSKEEALESFSGQHGGFPLQDLLEDNPLPASFILHVDRPGNIRAVAADCEELGGILSIRYRAQLVERYLKWLVVLVGISLATIVLLVVFTFSSINNIIGLSIYARRTEIRIMQLVGATWWFIRWPFIFEGLFFGVGGAIAASLVIWMLLAMMGEALRLSELALALPGLGLSAAWLIGGLAVLLVGLGATVGFFGSLRRVNHFLAREAQIQLDASKVRQLVR